MLVKKHVLVLIGLFITAKDVGAVEKFSQDQSNYLSKIEVNPLLKNQANVVFAQERNLDKDLQIVDIANYFECQTMAGKHFLTSALNLPISPRSKCDTVANRKAIIAALMSSPSLKAEIDALFAEVKVAEQNVIELLSGEFRGASCPEEKQLELLKAMNHPLYGFTKFTSRSEIARTVTLGLNSLSLVGMAAVTVFLGKINYQMIKNGSTNADILFYNAYTGAMSGIAAYQLISDYKNALKKRDKIHALSKIVVAAEKIESLCAKYGINAQFKMSDIVDLGSLNLINELKSTRYSKETTYLFNTPKTHAFLYEIYEKDGCLADFFVCVAEMDACNAIATKMLNLQNQSNKFCFAKYIDNSKPEVKAIGFWNVLVDKVEPVVNDLHETRSVLFSGVNGGGKTSSTRAITQNILLAQTFGIAAATEFEFTPFDIIHSYLNVSDDLKAGDSLFVSEVKRAQEVKEKIRSIAGTDLKYFFALDELFTGTSDKAGQDCASSFIENIVKAPQIFFIYPTHFDKLKELGTNNSYCTNYKVDSAVKDENGKLVYPFTISRGASYDNIAIDIANNANLFN